MHLSSRLFVILMLLPIVGFGAFLVPMGPLQPLSGDLTRIGSYEEHRFGPNQPQNIFSQQLVDRVSSISGYDKYYDVIVLGDSFSLASAQKQYNWPNHLVDLTSLSVAVFSINQIDIEDLVRTPMFRKQPPLLVIYQTVERFAVTRGRGLRFLNVSSVPAAPESATGPARITIEPQGNQKIELRRPTEVSFLDQMVIQRDINLRVLRNTAGLVDDQVIPVQAAKSLPFSSVDKDVLLTLGQDWEKRSVTRKDIAQAVSGYKKLQEFFTANGFTQFELLVIPDKTSAYQQFVDADNAVPSVVPDLVQPVGMVNLLPQFQSAVANGVVDLYLPNDTHTSVIGHHMTAQALIDRLIAKNVFLVARAQNN